MSTAQGGVLCMDQAQCVGTVAMTHEEACACVVAINAHLQGARALLLDLYERQGWVALGYASWRECVVAEFGQSQRHLYRELEAAQVEREICPMGQIGVIPERQLRPLAPLAPDEQRPVWERATELAQQEGSRVMARHTEQAVAERRSMDVHYTSNTAEWYTPPEILQPVLALFQVIDLDPCSNSHETPNVPARRHFTKEDDGLAQPWRADSVFVNPPYGDHIGPWVVKLCEEYESGNVARAIALLPARPDTVWFQPV
jgi:DNA N-6-adenine-methyltransferase (Dam)